MVEYLNMYTLLFYCCTDFGTIEIFDLTTNQTVFEGSIDDCKASVYINYGVCSFEMSDKPFTLIVNIETE